MNASLSAVHMLLCLSLRTWSADPPELSGTVTAVDDGRPLAGVNVLIPELGLGAITDDRGHYRIAPDHGGTFLVQFTHVGMETVFGAVTLADAPVMLDVKMKASREQLKVVNVIGRQVSVPRETSHRVDVMPAREMREHEP
jgi:hypothetical protein